MGGTGMDEAPETEVSTRVAAWNQLIEDLLENALETWRAGDLRGTVETIAMIIRALTRRVHLR